MTSFTLCFLAFVSLFLVFWFIGAFILKFAEDEKILDAIYISFKYSLLFSGALAFLLFLMVLPFQVYIYFGGTIS